jgi:hypothetical protein
MAVTQLPKMAAKGQEQVETHKEVNLKTYVIVAGVLTALGFLLTFPPFFDLFAGA